MKRVLLTISLCLLGTSALAHWEDPQGCGLTREKITEIKEWSKVKEGLSEDGRDYVITWKAGDVISEEHYQLAPKSQWSAPDEPAVLPSPISEWLDWDGDGFFGEWFLFPRGQAACEDALHFVWSSQLQTYVLYAKGKERT
jgi:hypothetical protein